MSVDIDRSTRVAIRRRSRTRGGERRAPRTGAKRTVLAVIRQIPDFLRMLVGLLRDPRVARVDKLLVAGAIAYTLMPADLIPDIIPFLGQVDDVFLVTTAVQRLIRQAGRAVVTEHWPGDPADVHPSHLQQILLATTFFLPGRVRRGLERLRGR